MKNQSESMIERCTLDAMGIPLHVNKGENEMQVFNLACAFCSLHGYNSWRANTCGLYLLRGAGGREEDVLFGLKCLFFPASWRLFSAFLITIMAVDRNYLLCWVSGRRSTGIL